MIDRSEINRALAKAIAYSQCGKRQEAQAWAARLVELLECADILAPDWLEDGADRVKTALSMLEAEHKRRGWPTLG